MLTHKDFSIIWPKGKKVEMYCDSKAVVSTITSEIRVKKDSEPTSSHGC
jgi:hypothetical protein